MALLTQNTVTGVDNNVRNSYEINFLRLTTTYLSCCFDYKNIATNFWKGDV